MIFNNIFDYNYTLYKILSVSHKYFFSYFKFKAQDIFETWLFLGIFLLT